MDLRISAQTRRNNIKIYDKPNEDYFLINSEKGIFILSDGVSRDAINNIYPKPSPSASAAKVFTETAFEYLERNLTINSDVLEILKSSCTAGNQSVEIQNKKYYEKEVFRPGTVAIVVVIQNNRLYYCYLGDVSCRIVDASSEIQLMTQSQTEKFRKYSKAYDRNFTRTQICNNPQHPLSYGVFNGDERAINFLTVGTSDLASVKIILLSTDGLDCFYDFNDSYDFDSVELGLLFDIAENLDKQFESVISSDDKTVIRIQIS